MKASTQSKFNFFVILRYLTAAFFGLCIFSIPSCSFIPGLRLLTWGFTLVFLALVGLQLIFKYKIELDLISCSIPLFIVASLISSALNLFKAFVFTPIYLSSITFFIYCYLKQTKDQRMFLTSAFFGLCLFAFVFIYHYRSEFLSLHFSRLGSDFGDENDIAICFSLGFVLAVFNIFKKRNIILLIISIIMLPVLGICGFSTGSKTFVALCVVSSVVFIALFFGKKKWYWSVIICGSLLTLGLILLSLPMFSSIKHRLLEMFSTLFGQSVGGARDDDLSTIGRIQMLFDGIELFLRKPLFGFGINGFFAHSSFGYAWSHNHISEILCSFGIVGTVFFHVGFFVSIKSYVKQKNKELLVPFIICIFFIISMLSVALISQKIFAYVIAISYSWLSNLKDFKEIEIKKIFRKKSKVQNA